MLLEINEIVPYAVWNPVSVQSTLTIIEVKYDGYSFNADPREVDMSQGRTEVFKESTVPEFSMSFIILLVELLIIMTFMVRKMKHVDK